MRYTTYNTKLYLLTIRSFDYTYNTVTNCTLITLLITLRSTYATYIKKDLVTILTLKYIQLATQLQARAKKGEGKINNTAIYYLYC